MTFTKVVAFFFLSSALSLASSDTASAAPPEIKPGPGMPSLASLGVTAAQLADPNYGRSYLSSHPSKNKPGVFSAVRECYIRQPGQRGNAISCRNYLIAASTQTVTIAAGSDHQTIALCYDKNNPSAATEISGWNLNGRSGALIESNADIAISASWIIDNCSACSSDTCDIEGQSPGDGNLDFFVYIAHGDTSSRLSAQGLLPGGKPKPRPKSSGGGK